MSITKQNQSVDLVVSGVNEGSNLGPLVYTLSGTLGAAYVAVGRGIPAIAVSGQNSTKVDYKDWDPEDESAVGELGSSVLEGWALSRETIADGLPDFLLCACDVCSQRPRKTHCGPRLRSGLRT